MRIEIVVREEFCDGHGSSDGGGEFHMLMMASEDEGLQGG
jgi:hypothetical protein